MYRTADAETIVLALGSVTGTIADVVDELREQGARVGLVALRCFRPFPAQEVRAALAGARTVVVLERAFAVGVGGIVSQDVRAALAGLPAVTHTVIAGLGGRAITRRSLRELFEGLASGAIGPLHFLDLRHDVVERELERVRAGGRLGPHAESILRDLGLVAGGSV